MQVGIVGNGRLVTNSYIPFSSLHGPRSYIDSLDRLEVDIREAWVDIREAWVDLLLIEKSDSIGTLKLCAGKQRTTTGNRTRATLLSGQVVLPLDHTGG